MQNVYALQFHSTLGQEGSSDENFKETNSLKSLFQTSKMSDKKEIMIIKQIKLPYAVQKGAGRRQS